MKTQSHMPPCRPLLLLCYPSVLSLRRHSYHLFCNHSPLADLIWEQSQRHFPISVSFDIFSYLFSSLLSSPFSPLLLSHQSLLILCFSLFSLCNCPLSKQTCRTTHEWFKKKSHISVVVLFFLLLIFWPYLSSLH